VWVTSAVAVAVTAASLALTFVRLPYYTLAPGDVVDMGERVTVAGEPADIDGEVLLLFVRQRARINGWRYIQAQLDDDIDLFREEEFSGGFDPDEVRTLAQADMALSQIVARRVALRELGYRVPRLAGLVVLGVFPDRPADGVLEAEDVVFEANGQTVSEPQDLRAALRDLAPGDSVELLVRRGDDDRVVTVGTERGDDGSPVMGIVVGPRYDFPIDVEIDTGSIGGPSAGLAMTLSILDALSPADLTGGRSVAVTGEIRPDGTVGIVGGVEQKAVTARAHGADLFLVPADEVARARARAGDLEVVGVRDVRDALEALEAAGGEPLVRTAGLAAA
jgi:PDZ domain-containing protein